MREVLRLTLLKFLSNLAASFSGPWGWIAKVLIKPVTAYLLKTFDSMVTDLKNYLKKLKDEKNAEQYDETLKDNADEQKQDQASSDLLNRH